MGQGLLQGQPSVGARGIEPLQDAMPPILQTGSANQYRLLPCAPRCQRGDFFVMVWLFSTTGTSFDSRTRDPSPTFDQSGVDAFDRNHCITLQGERDSNPH